MYTWVRWLGSRPLPVRTRRAGVPDKGTGIAWCGQYDAVVEWRRVEVFAPSALAWEVMQASVDEGDVWAQLFKISFRGTYRPGSAGRADADLMIAITAAALAGPYPDVVVFDLTSLDYEWGNGLLDLFSTVGERDRDVPVGCVVAAGPGAFPALATLVRDGTGWLFSDLDAAIERSVELALERSRAIG